MVRDIYSGLNSSNPTDITKAGSQLFFTAITQNDSVQLWTSYGTLQGTHIVKKLLHKGTSIFPERITTLGTNVFFVTINSDYKTILWKSDGTATGTKPVFKPVNGFDIKHLNAVNGLLFFTMFTKETGTEVYRSDGTEAGTFLLKDIYPGNDFDDTKAPFQLTSYNNRLYFSATERNGHKLWSSDGTSAGTIKVAGNHQNITLISEDDYEDDVSFTVSNNILYFLAKSSATGSELYKYNAYNDAEVKLVKDITAGSKGTGFFRGEMIDVNNIESNATVQKLVNNAISVYPNPVHDVATVNITGKGNNTVKIVDNNGKVVWQQTTDKAQLSIPCGQLASGFYVIEVTNNNKTSSIKIIKE